MVGDGKAQLYPSTPMPSNKVLTTEDCHVNQSFTDKPWHDYIEGSHHLNRRLSSGPETQTQWIQRDTHIGIKSRVNYCRHPQPHHHHYRFWLASPVVRCPPPGQQHLSGTIKCKCAQGKGHTRTHRVANWAKLFTLIVLSAVYHMRYIWSCCSSSSARPLPCSFHLMKESAKHTIVHTKSPTRVFSGTGVTEERTEGDKESRLSPFGSSLRPC